MLKMLLKPTVNNNNNNNKQSYFLVIKFLALFFFFYPNNLSSNRNLNIYLLYMITITKLYLGTKKITNISNYLKSN